MGRRRTVLSAPKRLRQVARSGARLAVAAISVSMLIAPTNTPAQVGDDRATGAITFVCGPPYKTLCRIAAGGGTAKVIATSDSGTFKTPSISADGTRLAFVRGSTAYAADGTSAKVKRPLGPADAVVVRPDGARVLLLKSVPACPYPREECKTTGYDAATIEWTSGAPRERPAFVAGATWLTRTRLLAISGRDSSTLLTLPTSGCCGRVFLRDRRFLFYELAVSADGRTVAASASLTSGAGMVIVLITVADHAIQALTPIPRRPPFTEYVSPAWSPDSRWLVFVRRDDKGIDDALVMARAQPRARVIDLHTTGVEPAWGRR